MNSYPGPDPGGFPLPTLQGGSVLNKFILNDQDAGVYKIVMSLGGGDTEFTLRGWVKITDARGRNGILNGRLSYDGVGGGGGGVVVEGEIQSP